MSDPDRPARSDRGCPTAAVRAPHGSTGDRRRLRSEIATPTVASAAPTQPASPNILARAGRGLWRLLTSVDFAVAQIILLVLLALVGMTIKQLPTFAFRSVADYVAAMDDIHTRYDPLFGYGARRHPRST